MSKRNWRHDRIDRVGSESPERPPPEGTPVDHHPVRKGGLGRWRELALCWARSRVRQQAAASLPSGEKALHEFGAVLAATDDRDAIERALVEQARRLVGRHDVRWIRQPSGDASDDPAAGRFLVRRGQRVCGMLAISLPEGAEDGLAPLTSRRLRTLCNLMAAAGPLVAAPARPEPGDAELEGLPRTACLIPGVQDATFLHAVLPYAIGQARRHGEPLSVLCMAVDRLAGIADLLGKERAEGVLRNTAVSVASQIRSSDFVSRLDDNRLLAVLPRASLHDSTHVAEKLSQAIARDHSILPEAEGVSISIGVAEYPACADNVFSLIDAADHALSLARGHGRGQVEPAPALAVPDPIELTLCAS